MYYTIYEIKNNLNEKIYIGAHKTKDINDGYMSSSEVIKKSMKKYGRENFTKTILHFLKSEKEMFEKEKEIVNENFVKRTDTYNIKEGGNGGWSHWNGTDKHIESCKKGGNMRKENMPRGEPFKKGDKKTIEASKNGIEKLKEDMKNNPEKYKEKYKKISKSIESCNNGMYKKCWCVPVNSTDYQNDKKVFDKDNIPEGWISVKEQRDNHKDKSNSHYGKFWIYNPKLKLNKYHKEGPIPKGWIKGRKMEYYKIYKRINIMERV